MEILVPIDDSEPARAALEHARRQYPDAEITLLHVIDPNFATYGEGGVYAYESVLEGREATAEKLLADVRELTADHDGPITEETTVGDPAREIVAFADERGVDHVVIGSHGRSGASRILLGSVAERVARRAPVPVTIVR
ncbi:universal stress protein [Haloterrigena alkaliphila]|uniref:Universal stress protein n=1 Tax=Haloterrigena alkaliphila TaxID=2816475 RepID=A0A8A2VAE7_9EURY|nr:universal stress protein [Haloterrigena alkaliphila]QSW98451.1 universal stress protein [Haloterrigena alkaliphila]